jgi:hypothetical protein
MECGRMICHESANDKHQPATSSRCQPVQARQRQGLLNKIIVVLCIGLPAALLHATDCGLWALRCGFFCRHLLPAGDPERSSVRRFRLFLSVISMA